MTSLPDPNPPRLRSRLLVLTAVTLGGFAVLNLDWPAIPSLPSWLGRFLQAFVEQQWLLLAVAALGGVISLRAWRWLPRIPRAEEDQLVWGGLAVVSLLTWLVLTGNAGFLWWVLAGVGLAALVYGVVVVPQQAAPSLPPLTVEEWEQLDSRDRAELANARQQRRNEMRNTMLQGIAGLAVLAGVVVAWQQLAEDRRQAVATLRQSISAQGQAAAAQELTLQAQASERFTAAIGQLESDRIETQIGGIYGLEQIAQQAPHMRLTVTEVLVAYVRRRAPLPETSPPRDGPRAPLAIRAPDVQAALTVLGRRDHEPEDPPLNLEALDLAGADLSGAFLVGADLAGAGLAGADLVDAFLVGADLSGADLSDAFLVDASLAGAGLAGADLSGAFLSGADLSDAFLVDASLAGVDLSDAFLVDATLADADLSGAFLASADLSDAFLDGAVSDVSTSWPSGFDWRAAGVRMQP